MIIDIGKVFPYYCFPESLALCKSHTLQVSHIVKFRSFSSNPSEAYASTCPSTGPMSIDDGISTSLINRQSSQLYRAEAKDVLLDGHMLT